MLHPVVGTLGYGFFILRTAAGEWTVLYVVALWDGAPYAEPVAVRLACGRFEPVKHRDWAELGERTGAHDATITAAEAHILARAHERTRLGVQLTCICDEGCDLCDDTRALDAWLLPFEVTATAEVSHAA